MACGQFVLYYVISLAVMGHPKDTSGCHCVLSLCHLMYCHLPKYLTMAYEKIQKMLIPPTANDHLLILSCHSSCVHGAFKIIKQLVHRVVLSLTLHQIIPPLHPSPPAVCGPRAFFVRSIHGGARGEELLQDGGVAGDSRVVQRCRHLRRRRARRRQRLEGSTPWLSTAKPRLQWEKHAICRVNSVSFIFFKIV